MGLRAAAPLMKKRRSGGMENEMRARGEVDQSQPHWRWQHTPFRALTYVSSFTSQDHCCRPSANTHTHSLWLVYTHSTGLNVPAETRAEIKRGFPPNPCVVPSVRQVLPAWLLSPGWGWHWHQSIHTMPSQRRAPHVTTASQLTTSPPPASLLIYLFFKVYQDLSFCPIHFI